MKGKKKKPRIKTTGFSVNVSKLFYREMERIVLSEGYTNVSDYVRDLIRNDFRERGVTVQKGDRRT